MRLPYINLRWLAVTLVVVLLAGGATGGYLWYNARPDKLWESALNYYHQGEKLRGAADPQKKPSDDDKAKAKKAYEDARTQVEKFIGRAPKDPRLVQAHLLRFKILWSLADVNPEDRANLQGEAFRSGQAAAQAAAAVDDRNVEVQAVMVAENFRRNDFSGAYPYARTLIDNLPIDPKAVDLDNFNEYVIGAYYVVALKDLQNNHPDDALKDLEAGLAKEKPRPGGPGKPEQRWRALLVQVQALQRKVELSKGTSAAKAPEDTLKDVLKQSVERARAEVKETVPATEGNPELPRVASLSLTNTNGLIDVLLASVFKADSHQAVSDRADLLLQVCEKMANTAGAKPWVYQDAVRGSGRLALMNGSLPAANRLDPNEMVAVQAKTLAINDAVLNNGGPIDPMAYLEMSRTAQQAQNDRPRALELAKRGLKVAADQNPPIPDKDSRVLALRSQVAWLLLLDRKVKEAEVYLTQIAKEQRLSTDVAYMRGLGAVLDGRLEEGVQQLNVARTAARYKESLPLLLGLSHAYLGQGQLENAVPVLEDVIRIRKVQEGKNRDDEIWIKAWQPTLTHSSLDLLKCYLALSLKATNKRDAKDWADRAGVLFKELQPTFLAEDAQAAVFNYDLTRLRALAAKDPNSIEADVLRGEIGKRIDKLPASSKNDPRILWVEVNYILSQRETNPAVVGAAIAAPLGAPTDLAVRLGEMGRLRAGLAWQWEKAEERIMKAAAEQKDSVATQLAWVRWLLLNGRSEEALARLTELEDTASDDKERRRIKAAEARLLLQRGDKTKADQIIQDLRKGGQDLTAELLYADELLMGGDPVAARKIIDDMLSKQDQTGLYHFWKGQLAQSEGNFVQAIQSYERSLEFTQFKARSEGALLACVLGIADGPPGRSDKADPKAAFKEAERLKAAHPHTPGVLLAFAVMARVMDQVDGDGGMQGALNEMMRVLSEEKANAANGPYVAAQQWIAAGRPDVARLVLKPNKKHLPSLVLATQLAFADEDWAEAAADLKAVAVLQPDAIDLPLWRALLHESRGETKEAREIYEKFIEDHPKLNTGYLAMARLHERAKEYKEALAWVKKWREKMPDELNGLNGLVRVLTEDGQAAEAAKEADAFIKEQVAKLRTARDEWETKNPITEKDKDKAKEEADNRAKARQAMLADQQLALSQQFIGVFQQAKAFAEAEKWLDGHVVPLLDKLPESTRKHNNISLKMIRAALNMSRGRLLKEKDPERARLMGLAIKEYEEVYEKLPGDLVSGNNLAYLKVKEEKNQSSRAVELVDEVRMGKYSRQPISPERLPLELLDTIGVVYHAAGLNQQSLVLFEKAVKEHYAKEPRLLIYLGLAQAGLEHKTDAYSTFRDVMNLADAQAKATPDPERKERLVKLKDYAHEEQRKLGIVK